MTRKRDEVEWGTTGVTDAVLKMPITGEIRNFLMHFFF
jgi:hypothetical protein